jgi:hypothetical protein
MNQRARNCRTMSSAARQRRRPTAEEGGYAVCSLQLLEAVGYLTARVRQTLGETLENEFAPLGETLAQCIAIIGMCSMASTIAETCKGMPYDPGSMIQAGKSPRADLRQALANAWAQNF